MSEDDEDHVGCSGEGCPNKCAFCGDCGHVEDGFVGCGGAGHDVGVVHGYIAQVKKTTIESHTPGRTTGFSS